MSIPSGLDHNPSAHTDSFKHFEALEASERLARVNRKLTQLPCQIVFFDAMADIGVWFEHMGHVCPGAEFPLTQSNSVQLSHTEKNVFVFIPLQTLTLNQAEDLKAVGAWLLAQKKIYPLVCVTLLLSESASQNMEKPADINQCKRAITWAESLAKRQLQRSLHLQFQAPALNLPCLVLTQTQLLSKSVKAPLEAWRKHCLHTLDRSHTPWLWAEATQWLNNGDRLHSHVLTVFENLNSSKRHGRSCPPDVIALHPGPSNVSSQARQSLAFVTTPTWLSEKTRRCCTVASVMLVLTFSLYLALGLMRQSLVESQLSEFEKKSHALDAMNCSNIDSLEIADHDLRMVIGQHQSSIKFSAFLYKRQTQKFKKATDTFNQSIQRWTRRCLFSPVEITLVELLEQYVTLSNKKQTVTKSHEQAYQFLKTYLMFFQLKNFNTVFLKEQTVQILKSISKEKNFSLEQPLQQQRADRLLVHALSQPELSFPDSNTAKSSLVADVRKLLLSNLVAQNAEAQLFSRIIDTANGQLQSVGLLSALGPSLPAYFDNNPTILGAYTQDAFKTHVQGLIATAAKGELEKNDWVLDSVTSNSRLSPSDSLRAQLEAHYWKMFELNWVTALQSATLKPKLTSAELSDLFLLFSDESLSPCKRLVQTLHGLKTQTLLTSVDTAYRNVLGEPPQNSDAKNQFSVYAHSLQNLGALNQTQADSKSDDFFAQHWSESEGPAAIAQDWVQRQLGVEQSKLLQDALKQFFLLPVQFWVTAQLNKSGKALNARWASDVLPRLKTIDARYPFNPRGTDATPEEMAEFLSLSQGTVSNFIQRNLKGALKTQTEQWKVVKRFGQAPGFESEFLTLLNYLGQIRSPNAGNSPLSRFELRPIPNPVFMEQSFALEGQPLRYRNGPQIWSEFHWRGDQPQHLTRLSAQTTDGEHCAGPSWTGRMSWARALEAASIEKAGNDWVLSWQPCTDKSKKISFQYRHLQGLSPSELLLLNHWPTPPRIFKEASL